MKKREAPPQTRAITRLDDAITKNSLPEEEKTPTEEYIEAEAEHTRKFGGRKPMFEGFDRDTPLELRRPYMLAELKRGQDAELVAAAYMMVGAHSFQGKSQWQKDREEYMKTERIIYHAALTERRRLFLAPHQHLLLQHFHVDGMIS